MLCFFPIDAAATTVVGTIKDASGTALASGKIILRLSQEGTVSDPALLLIQPPVSCTISSGAIAAGCVVRANDTISPAGTFYKVRLITAAGQELLPERKYIISGTTWDIGTATPLATDTVTATAYQIVADEGTNVVQRQKLNFTGAGVSCADDSANARTNCSVSGGGAGSTHQIDGVNLTAPDPINFQDTAEVDFTNPAAGNLQAALKAASIADAKLASNYSGVGSCTNQFVRAANDNAAPTCADVAAADFAAQTANTVLAGPASGVPADPTFRALVDADIPAAIARDAEINVQGTADEIASTGAGVAPALSIASTFRITGKTATAPIKTGTTAPATCTQGDYFFDTDAPAGQNTYACTATNTWTLEGDGGGGGVAAYVLAAGSSATQAAGSTNYYGPWGLASVEVNSRWPLPTAGTVAAFYAESSGAPATGQSFTYTVVKNGADTTMTCTTSDTATTCNTSANPVSFVAGDTFSVKVVTSAAATAVRHHIGLKIT